MHYLQRPDTQPFHYKIVIGLLVLLVSILAIAAGYYQQRWLNQVKRSTRLEKRLEILTATDAAKLKVDPPSVSQ